MSEAELNERELEGVSGGGAHSVEATWRFYCRKCIAASGHSSLCKGSAEQLTDYVNQYGDLPTWGNCPFLDH